MICYTKSFYCLIETIDKDALLWMMLDGKGIEIITYVVILVSYISIKFHLSAQVSKSKTYLYFIYLCIQGYSIKFPLHFY